MMKFRLLAQLALALTLSLSLSACLTDSSTESDPSIQQGPIKITITNPSTSSLIETPDAVVSVGGTAGGSNLVESVIWKNDMGGSGRANGTANWTTGNIVLQLGRNTITVTATDTAGDTDSQSIVVNRENSPPLATGTVTLNWTAPTQRIDNTPLTNLAAYRILFGPTPGVHGNEIFIDHPGLTTYVVDNLSSGRWYFVLTAIDADGWESSPSNEVSKTIQ